MGGVVWCVAEYGDIYRDISIGVNIEGFQAYVVMVSHCGGKFGTKYRWCCIGSSKLFEIFCIDFVGVSGSHYILKLGQNELFLLTI